jgi:TP901 family phage tail tape measure protein
VSRFVLTAQLQLQAPSNVRQVVQQIQNQLNNVRVDVQVQGAQQAQRQLNQVTASTNDAANAATRLGRSFGLSIKRFAAFSIATRAVSLFTSTLSKAVEESIAFERELIKISQVTGKTLGQLRDLTSEITRLSTSLGVSSTSLLSVSRILSQAGLNADETRIALDALAKSELAPTFDDIQQTAEGVVAVFNQFQQGAAALEAQLGSINAVAGKFAVEAGDLISVVRRTGGVFKAAGGDLNELIALFTSVRATTRESAESIATGLRTIFTRIQRPETIEFLRQYGVELLDLEGKFVGPFEATKRLSEALAGLEQGDITFVKIAEELGGFRQIGKVIPLLQQFSVAQEALNVAQKGSGSLADDAAKAQLSLAVRINKVKEEFLALVRSITETTSFQLFANTALNLASALIKLADALKPIIPLLTAFAGIKLATGVGSFIRGIGGGLRTPRGFATGGLVPGSGNRDTVPAMLTPGEFVIRKSSVSKLGAGNLAAMNENRYAAGGIVHAGRGFYGNIDSDGRSLIGKTRGLTLVEALKQNFTRSQLSSAFGKDAVEAQLGTAKSANLAKERAKTQKRRGVVGEITVNPSAIGGFFLRPNKGTERDYKLNRKVKLNDGMYQLRGNINGFYTGKNDIAGGSIGKIVKKETKQGLKNSIISASNTIRSRQLIDLPPIDGNEKVFENSMSNLFKEGGAQSTIEGYMLEGIVSALSGANLAGGKTTFDYPILNPTVKQRLGSIFRSTGEINNLIKADAKRTGSSDSYKSIGDKLVTDIKKNNFEGVSVKRFATGGAVGTDTVPALLTPGEFVINRSSAQKIGYGSLNRMNKVGKYAKGGVVHKFASGTSGTGVPASSSGGMGLNFSAVINSSFNALASVADKVKKQFNKLWNDSILLDKNFQQITKVSPSLSQSLQKYYATLNLSDSQQKKKTDQIIQEISRAKKSGQTEQQILSKLESYKTSIDKKTKNAETILASEKKSLIVAERNRLRMEEYNKALLMRTKEGGNINDTKQRLAGKGQLTQVRNEAVAKADQALIKFVQTLNNASTSNTKEAMSSQQAALEDAKEAVASRQAAAADQQQSRFSMGMGSGALFAAGALQSMLPVIDENSSAFTKATHSILGLVMSVASVIFALEMFNISLNVSTLKNFAKFFMGDGLGFGALRGLLKMGLSPAVVRATQGIAKVVGPVALMAATSLAVTQGFNALISSQYDYKKQLDDAIKSGDVAKAEQAAAGQYDLEAANASRTAIGSGLGAVGAGLGALLIPLLGPIGPIAGGIIGTAVGSVLGTIFATIIPASWQEAISVFFGGDTKASVVAMAGANAAASKAAKSLAEANDKTSKAMEEFRNGTASATDVVKASSQATADALTARQKANTAIEENEKNKSSIGRGAIAREIGAYLTFGYVDTARDRNKKIDEENKALDEGAKKAEQDAIKAAMPGLQVLARETAATGGSFADFQERIKATDPALAELLLRNGANEIKKTFENLAKEAEKTRKAFDAMNLGFQNVAAISGALSVNMANYLASQEAGYSQLDNTIRTLEASVTSAAQGISDDAFTGALANARAGLEKLGATDEQIKKFEENLTAINTVQKNYAKASEETKNRLVAEFQRGSGAGQSPEQKKNTFADVVADQLAGAGIGEEVRNRISDAIKGADISGDDLEKILAGDLSVLDKVLTELGDKTLSQVIGPLQELAKYEQELVNITKKRLELENQVVSAQQNLIAAQAEAAEIIAKYGGPAFTPQMQTQSILDQANVQSDAAGVSRLNTGSAAELNQRSMETRAGLDQIAGVRQRAAAGDEAAQAQLSGESGVRLQEQEKRLQELAKSDYDTTKKLIQQKEKELQVIQEKNKAEKAAIDSLLAGDIDKWFEQQAAVGATAAIATGNRELMNAFGAKAVGMAAQDIKRQQDAGVTELYGQQLAGPGGLTERGYSAGLSMRGVSTPGSMAQVAAGTTGEEEAAKSQIRELAATLPNYAATQLQVAEDSLQTANIQYQAAEMQLQAAKQNAKDRGVEVAGMARGGPVYANNGIFVPRGTDTVPAMLTPGEFVVRRAAVQRGNNLQILQAMNRGQSGVSNSGAAVGMANGGVVRYRQQGSDNPETSGSGGVGFGLSSETVQGLTTALNDFNTKLKDNIQKLNDTTFHVKLDNTNINVNLTGGSFLSTLKSDIGEQVLATVGREIINYKVGNDGKLYKSQGLTSNQ